MPRSNFLHIVFFSLCLILLSPHGLNASFQHLIIGNQLSQISGKDIITDKKVSTDNFLNSGENIVVMFWAEWSERSIDELQYLQELSILPKNNKIKFLTVYTGQYNNLRLIEFIKKSHITLPVIYDRDQTIAHSFGLIAIPSTIITCHNGIIRHLFSGFSLTAKDTLSDSIDELLGNTKERPITQPKNLYQPHKKALRYYNVAFKLFRRNSYEQALINLEKSQSFDSTYLLPYQLQSIILFKLEKYDMATTLCKKLIKKDSTLTSPYLLLSKDFIRKKLYQDAIVLLNKLLNINDDYLDARFLLVTCYMKSDKIIDAQNSLDFIFSQYSKHPKAFLIQGILHASNEDKESAINSFVKAGEIIFP